MSSEKLSTTGEIAQRYGVPLHRIEYLVKARGIEPTARAGHIRVFSEADVGRIGKELDRVDERMGGTSNE